MGRDGGRGVCDGRCRVMAWARAAVTSTFGAVIMNIIIRGGKFYSIELWRSYRLFDNLVCWTVCTSVGCPNYRPNSRKNNLNNLNLNLNSKKLRIMCRKVVFYPFHQYTGDCI